MATIALAAPPTPEDIAQHPRVFAAWRVLCIDALQKQGAVRDANTVLLGHLREFATAYGNGGDPTEPLTFAQLVQLFTNIDCPPDKCTALVAPEASLQLVPRTIGRRALGVADVRVEVVFCGICHTDIDCLMGEWAAGSWFPQVAGHEIVGIVTGVGEEVSSVQIGDAVGVGFMCRTCGTCSHCNDQTKGSQFCARRVYTFNAQDWDGSITHGGFSSFIVVHERCVLHIPAALSLPAAAPLLCAGITTYSAIKRFDVAGEGKHVGVVGLGGLGHLAVRILKAMGTRVTVLSRCVGRALKNVMHSTPIQAVHGQLTTVLDTVSGQHNVAGLLPLLTVDGSLVLLGIPEAITLRPFDILPRRLSLAGSVLGSIQEHQELLDIAAEHNLLADVEVVRANEVDKALQRVASNQLHGAGRIVVDILSL